MAKAMAQTVGRRKSAVAQVRIFPGKGEITVNKRSINDYFQRIANRNILLDPLKLVNSEGQYHIIVNVRGGGHDGRSGALRVAGGLRWCGRDGEWSRLFRRVSR